MRISEQISLETPKTDEVNYLFAPLRAPRSQVFSQFRVEAAEGDFATRSKFFLSSAVVSHVFCRRLLSGIPGRHRLGHYQHPPEFPEF